LDGYQHDVKPQVYLETATLEETTTFFTTTLKKFLDFEAQFQGLEESAAVSALAKANKDDLSKIVPSLIAHKQVQSRVKVVLSLLRQLEFLPQRMKSYTPDTMPAELRETLEALASLVGNNYGEMSLKAKQLIDDSLVPPFQVRLDSLKTAVMESNVDLKTLAKQPDIAVSVDLLVVLLADPDSAVRKAALEVYLRRVYRAHCIKTLTITEQAGSISASWSFTNRDTVDVKNVLRHGYFTMFPDFASLQTVLPDIIKDASSSLSTTSASSEPLNVLHIGFSTHCNNEDTSSALAQTSLASNKSALKKMNLRAVNFLLVNPGKKVSYLNFLSEADFVKEDLASRNMRPTMPQLLELNRLTLNHELERLATVGRNSQLYLGREKSSKAGAAGKGKKAAGTEPQVLFLRSISLSAEAVSPVGSERMLVQAMDELERASLDPRVSETASSRVYLNILPEVQVGADEIVKDFKMIMDVLISKYATRLLKLNVDEVEVKVRVLETDGTVPDQHIPVRLIASSSTGGWLTREAYREYLDPVTGQTVQYCSLTGENPVCILDPYPTSNILQIKRATARRVGSTYAPDFLGLMEVALINAWQSHFERAGKVGSPPPSLFTFDELVLGKDGQLKKEKRFPGINKVGMLAWHTVLKTPQYPEGREVIMIANDVTVQSGSFGVQEDDFFFAASVYARKRGIPRVFISCNSGARIGLVDELKPKFKVAWKEESNPSLGFDYLYLSEEDYLALPKGTVDAVAVIDKRTGETRWQLEAIIGQTNGIGVENLRGSGLIAGETARAYDETFTLSYVTGRSVGIGAYLNRLGQRVIQMEKGPMILTGFSALNKLLGKEVYTSQDQLGGPQIMYPNGITHEVVQNDKEGMQAVVDWLNYTPKDFHSIAPHALTFADPPSRKVEFTPSKTPYDPRHMLGGTVLPDGSFQSGFFDKGTFKEYLGGWGKSVVTGRAQLGGINVGVIAVETRLVEQRIPADPGNPESREVTLTLTP
jgi:acetyl-CoA carboxylase/biotin carboxylase 1